MPFGTCFTGLSLNHPYFPAFVGDIFRFVFYGAIWEDCQTEYGWQQVDNAVNAAIDEGLVPYLKIGTRELTTDVAGFAEFAGEVAMRYKGLVPKYAILNEIDNPKEAWSAESYSPLRAAAYRAIKDIDPDAIVLDSGFTMATYIVAMARDAESPEEALELLASYAEAIQRKNIYVPRNMAQLDRWLNTDISQRRLGLLDELLANTDSWDALQAHFLQDAPDKLPHYLAFLKNLLAKAGVPDRPLLMWEIGYGRCGAKKGDPLDDSHAPLLAITLATAAFEGADDVIQEPCQEGPYQIWRGFVSPNGEHREDAIAAVSTMAEYVQGTGTQVLSGNVWAYRCGRNVMFWARDEEEPVRIPASTSLLWLVDMRGNRRLWLPFFEILATKEPQYLVPVF
jgi:hypothetical protein